MLHLSEGAKASNVGAFVEALAEHGGDATKIKRVSLDMARSFIAGAREHLPEAVLSFDPFHVIKLANEAVDAVRRAEVAQRPELRRTRYHWLKDASDWTQKELGLNWLRHSDLKTARAWRLKERLRDIVAWRRIPRVPVVTLMQGWMSWACRSRLEPFKRLAHTLKTHWDGVVGMLESAASNARAESINADIQAAIARARGFSTFRNLRSIVYLCKGGLGLPESPFARA